MLRFLMSFFGAIFSLIVTALVFIALTVGGVLWIYSHDLPSYEQLAQYAPKTVSRIYSGEGQLIDEFAEERRIFVPIDEIPPLVKQAFISAEDKNFYTHHGFDPRGIGSAALDFLKGSRLRGGSTIPQQVAKNFLLSGERSIERKVKELILATRLVQALPKDRLLELYLNEIYLGQNSYGVASAALTYFNKSLDELSPAEAAMLASMPREPARSHPVRDHDKLLRRRNEVLREMSENGYITKATYEAEVQTPIRSVQGGDYPNFRTTLPPRDYFTDEIRRQLSREFGEEEFFSGGLTIRATVDPQLQTVAAKALQKALEQYDRNRGIWRGTRKTLPLETLSDEEAWRAALRDTQVPRDIVGWSPAVVLALTASDARIGIEGVETSAEGEWIPAKDVQWARKRLENGKLGNKAKVASDLLAVGDVVLVRKMTDDKTGAFLRWTLRQVPEIEGGFMAMDVKTGRVLAMQGGFSYQSSVFNRATQAQRQPGSSFKPFVYAAALDNGYTPATIIVDEPIAVNTPQGLWTPKNSSGKFYGPTPMRIGIEQSRNLMTIRIAQDIGMDLVAKYAEAFGAYDKFGHFLANSLGAQETTLFKMVAAYAMFANGGMKVEPTLVDRVQDRRGRTVYRHDQRQCETCGQPNWPANTGPLIAANGVRVLDAITAYQVTSMMEGVVKRGSGRGVNLPVPIAGKTGTTNDAKDVWFIGFSSNIVAGCYLGYDQPRTLGGNAFGGTLCVPVFQEFMQQAIKEYGGTAFQVPPGGHFVNVDRFTGARLGPDAKGANVIAEYFRNGSENSDKVIDGGFGRVDPNTLPLYSMGSDKGQEVTTSTGQKKVIPKKADFGTLSSGGLY
ncbi:penicillin-binding protein 1A [Paracoccus aminophilus]|uniref:Penicillin-binding protein 1A n=1 Tax=Paracoccus aminophilus JCM 7686 TaxID=1367847 RepID=S5XMC0_PARAH|nr:penicillin-binding protein 1A [Paracoccus aminophilus]AGT08449.1 penicillin-binding protein 1A [Paracoccus aminophilus JCM 7686]